LLAPLPGVAVAATIDGTTQPGFGGSPLITLDGANAGTGADGLLVTAGRTTIKGLSIVRFSGSGLVLSTNGGDVVEGDLIGSDVASGANGGDGIRISTSGNTIGASSAGSSNIIAHNNGHGVNVLAG